MGYKVIYISQAEHLHLYLDNLKVEKENTDILIPIADIQILVIDNYKASIIFYGSFEVESGSLSEHISSSVTEFKRNCILDSTTSAASVFGSCIAESKLAFTQNDLYDFDGSKYTGILKNASTGHEILSFSSLPSSVFLNTKKLWFGVQYTFSNPPKGKTFANTTMSVSVSVGI